MIFIVIRALNMRHPLNKLEVTPHSLLTIITMICISGTYSSCIIKTLPLATTILLSVSYQFGYCDKGICLIYVWLISLGLMSLKFIKVAAYGKFCLFLKTFNSPLCINVTFCYHFFFQ